MDSFEGSFVNLTPHEIVVMGDDDSVLRRIPPSGRVARVASTTSRFCFTDGVPISHTAFGPVEGLPEFENGSGVLYIVSSMVQMAAELRSDLVVPVEPVRNDAGQVIGCRSLMMRQD